MHRLRRHAKANQGQLLRLLLLRRYEMPARAGRERLLFLT
jgi:hypothetical protein